MEQNLIQLTNAVNDIKKLVHSFHHMLEKIETRLDRLEKMDSIEHRVAVNQIDLSDIKESIERMEELQKKEIENMLKVINNLMEKEGNETIQYIHRRLDSHLIKLAKAEEEIIILKNR
jgi:hypothetical protein